MAFDILSPAQIEKARKLFAPFTAMYPKVDSRIASDACSARSYETTWQLAELIKFYISGKMMGSCNYFAPMQKDHTRSFKDLIDLNGAGFFTTNGQSNRPMDEFGSRQRSYVVFVFALGADYTFEDALRMLDYTRCCFVANDGENVQLTILGGEDPEVNVTKKMSSDIIQISDLISDGTEGKENFSPVMTYDVGEPFTYMLGVEKMDDFELYKKVDKYVTGAIWSPNFECTTGVEKYIMDAMKAFPGIVASIR